VAGILFVLPGALLMWLIAMIYVTYGRLPVVEAIFDGLKPAVLAIVLGAVLRIGRKVLRHPALWAISAGAFIGIYFFRVPFPWIILGAAILGWVGDKWVPAWFRVPIGHGSPGPVSSVIGDGIHANIAPPTIWKTIGTLSLWSAIWLLPVLLCLFVFGRGNVLTELGLFFSKAAVVTFGGAYAVLPYVAQQAVEQHQWLTHPQMMDGLGLAETTPGPLILVLQFVGFLGGWSQPGTMPPWLMATLAAAQTSWVTFVPGFLFIFTGAPYIERAHQMTALNAALTAVTSAVVGVILNLAVWFAIPVVFANGEGFDLIAAGFALLCFVLLQRYKWEVLGVVALGAGFGLLRWTAGF